MNTDNKKRITEPAPKPKGTNPEKNPGKPKKDVDKPERKKEKQLNG